ncbi:MAG: BMP family ABC transporter substrate-binding protein [Clostridia bacterium]|nr:BMP family ABC transporter substrate-binding protein [Clostridia bacterium]
MDIRNYDRARQRGLRAYSQAVSEGKDPYLPVLEEKVPGLNGLNRLSLGIMSIPLDRVVGSVSRGRSFAFACNFMPILENHSEFGTKWGTLYESVAEQGLRDPVKVLEYMGYYYMIEGNKRASVMKYIGAEDVEADVTRVIPVRQDTPESTAYFEYCAFSRETGLYDLFCTRPGSYDRLSALPGMKSGEKWSQDDVMSLRKLFRYFSTAYHKIMQDQPAIPVGDAFLRWLLAFGYEDTRDNSMQEVEKSLKLMQEEFRAREDAMNLVLEHSDSTPAPSILQALFHPSKIKAAFLYTRPVNESAWNYWHEMGRLEAQEKLGSKVETVGRVVSSRTDTEEEIEKLVKEGFNVIFATSPVMLNSCVEPALKHPETRLLVSSQLAGYHHVHTYYLRFYEAKFLLGMLAGILSDNGKIGYITDYPIYGSPSMINAFAIGARMVNPQARIYLNWTSLQSFDQNEPFHDPEIRVICNRDLTAPNRDSRDSGLYVREGGEILSMATLVPRWGIFYRHVMELMLKGVFDSASATSSASLSYWWGIASDTLDLAFSSRCNPPTVRLIRNLQEQFRSQSFTPFEGELRDQKGEIRCMTDQRLTPAEVLCMDYLADCVVGSLPSPEELVPSARSLLLTQGIGSLAKADVGSISWTDPRK